MSILAKIGAFVLETLTTGMYAQPLDTLREFVQNSADSIRRAEAKGLLAPGEGKIEIFVDPKNRRLSIRDNGEGVPSDLVRERLINIGMSAKQLGSDAGFRGIGRIAGVAYCRNLSFITSFSGETKASVVSWDCEGIRRQISPTRRNVEAKELSEVIDHNTLIKSETASESDHYFEAQMNDIDMSVADLFLSWHELEFYLSQVAPVGFDAQRFIFAPKITEWTVKHGLYLPCVNLVIKGPDFQRQVFKPYKGHYHTIRNNYEIEIEDVVFYPENAGPQSHFWLWYGKSNLLGTIREEEAAGFRFRKHNIAIGGPERVAELFREIAGSNERFNGYYIGEIHVLSEAAIPNARRDGFEANQEWSSIRQQLIWFLRERSSDIRTASQARNRPVPKIVKAAQQVMREAEDTIQTGFTSKEHKEELLDRIQKEIDKTKLALSSDRNETEQKELQRTIALLDKTAKEVEQAGELVVRKLKSSLDRTQRKLIQDILATLRDVLDEEHYRLAKTAILRKYGLGKDRP